MSNPHSKFVKCLGFSHAREAVYGISKCKFCENLRLRTLRSRLEVFEKESSVFPRRAPEASAALRESATWGPDVELEAMERKFLSLRAVQVPGILNLTANFQSRQKLRPGEWMLNRQTVAQIWDLFGKAEVDLFTSQESSQCQLWFSLSSPATLGIDAFSLGYTDNFI